MRRKLLQCLDTTKLCQQCPMGNPDSNDNQWQTYYKIELRDWDSSLKIEFKSNGNFTL